MQVLEELQERVLLQNKKNNFKVFLNYYSHYKVVTLIDI